MKTVTFTYYVVARDGSVIFKTASRTAAYMEYARNGNAISVQRVPDKD